MKHAPIRYLDPCKGVVANFGIIQDAVGAIRNGKPV